MARVRDAWLARQDEGERGFQCVKSPEDLVGPAGGVRRMAHIGRVLERRQRSVLVAHLQAHALSLWCRLWACARSPARPFRLSAKRNRHQKSDFVSARLFRAACEAQRTEEGEAGEIHIPRLLNNRSLQVRQKHRMPSVPTYPRSQAPLQSPAEVDPAAFRGGTPCRRM